MAATASAYASVGQGAPATPAANSGSSGCDDAAMAKELETKSGARAKSANGMCETFTVQVGMLQDTRRMLQQCLVGRVLADATAALDNEIGRMQQSRSQVCVR